MSAAEEIFEKAKELSPPLQREALDFITFLAQKPATPDPLSSRFTAELKAAFAEAKAHALSKPAAAP